MMMVCVCCCPAVWEGRRGTQRFVSLFNETLFMSEKKVFVRGQQKMFRSKDGSTHKSHDVTFNPTNKQWIFGGRWSANPHLML